MKAREASNIHQALVEMPKRRSSRKSTDTTTVSASAAASQHQPTTPLRRSPRLLLAKPKDGSTHKPPSTENRRGSSRREPKKPSNQANERSSFSEISISGSKRSSKTGNQAKPISTPRRSPRFSSTTLQSGEDKANCKFVNSRLRISTRNRRGLLNGVKGKSGRDSCKETMFKKEKKKKDNKGSDSIEVIAGLKATGIEEVKADKKRKRGKECNVGNSQEWTREQELALQRAYFSAKPTPTFWKKVSKLVPGKSAQECFDKVHSDHMTPPQTVPRSRAHRISSSPLASSLFSASKLLETSGRKFKRLNCTKRMRGFAQKNNRKLLQKYNWLDQDHEADLFAIFEPNVNSSALDSQLNVAPSTPKHSQEREGFLCKRDERSSPCQQKPLSRFSGSLGKDLISPPVLKQVRNRALHEKYIDQLHCREAKRKSARVRKGYAAGKENTAQNNVQELDVVRTAKNALVSHARDAINQIKNLQTSISSNSSDVDDDGFGSDIDTIEDQS